MDRKKEFWEGERSLLNLKEINIGKKNPKRLKK